MNNNLFLKIRDRQFGPVPLQECINLIKQGTICKDDLVWNEETDEWIAADEVSNLKDYFFSKNGKNGKLHDRRIYAIAGGKGGIGKSVLSTSLGVGLASLGQKIILVDADFGGSNLHTIMGIVEPRYTFFEYYVLEKENLSDIVLSTPIENLGLISGTCGTLGLANPTYLKKQMFMQDLKKLHADSIILDLAAGASIDVIDFFLLADEKIVVATPEPTSLYEAFGFIKVSLMHDLHRALKDYPSALKILDKESFNRPGKAQVTIPDLLEEVARIDAKAAAIFKETLDSFQPKLILNMVKKKDHIKEGVALQSAVSELLAIHLNYLGYISYDPLVGDAVMDKKPFLLYAPECLASKDLSALIRVNILGKKGISAIFEKRKLHKKIGNYSKVYPTQDHLKDAPICSIQCAYWDNCEYQMGGHPCRVRHLEPVLRENYSV